jgi:hypothetical protein
MISGAAMKMDKKKRRGIFGAITGLAAVIAIGHWPSHAVFIQMALYSSFVLVPLFLGLWPDRHRDRFWPGMAGVVILHCAVLYLIRADFPFATVLIIVPTALTEAIVLFTLMLKLLGDGGAESGR